MTDIIPLDEQIRLTPNRDDKIKSQIKVLDMGGIGKQEVSNLIKLALKNSLIFIKKKNSFHFDQIQKILDKKAEGDISLDLDVLYKIHNNCHQECVEIIKQITKDFGTSFTETSPSNFCEKGMQETLSATEKSLNALYEAVKYSQEQL